MRYEISWLEAPWLVKIHLEGPMSLPEYEALIAEELRILDSADGNVYWVCDLRELQGGQGGLNAQMWGAMLKNPTLKHPRCRVFSIVGSTAMIKLVMASVSQSPQAPQSQLAATPLYPEIAEAAQFCREVAALDENRATKAELLPQSSNQKPE
jgi:hypothetical protein